MEQQFYSDARLKAIVLEFYKLDYITLFSKLCSEKYCFEFEEVKQLQCIAAKHIESLKKHKGFNPVQTRDKRAYNDPEEIAFICSISHLKNAAAYKVYLERGFKRKQQAFNMLRYYVRDNREKCC